jgi:hypothetical protein
MASPDFSPYVDLTINDKDPGKIYLEAVDYAAVALPEFSPRIGTVEDALLQAMAYVSGAMISAINRLPDSLMEGILALFGLVRKEATYATSTAIFTSIDSLGLDIPAGTQVGYLEATTNGNILHVFQTIESASIPAGSNQSPQVPVASISVGTVPYLVADDPLTLLTASTKLLSAKIGAAVVQGLSGELDIEYFARGANYLSSLSQGLVTASQISGRVLNVLSSTDNGVDVTADLVESTAWRCKTYDLTQIKVFEPTSNFVRVNSTSVVTATVPAGHGIAIGDEIRVNTPAGALSFDGYFTVVTSGATTITWSQAGANETITAVNSYIYNLTSIATGAANVGGQATIVICDEHGDPLSDVDSAAIVADIRSKTVAGLGVTYVPASIVDIALTATIAVKPGYSNYEVTLAVKEYIESVISITQWDWSSVIYANYVIARISQVEGVNYVSSITFSSPSNPIASLASNNITFLTRGTLPNLTATIGAL